MKIRFYESRILLFFYRMTFPFYSLGRENRFLSLGHGMLIENGNLRIIRSFMNAVISSEASKINSAPENRITQAINTRDIFSNASQKWCSILFSGDRFVRCASIAQYSKRKICFPLNKEWRKLANESQLEVQGTICCVMWFILSSGLLMKSLIRYSVTLSRISFTLTAEGDSLRRIYLRDLSNDCLPIPDADFKQEDFVNWIASQFEGNRSYQFVHDVKGSIDFEMTKNTSLKFAPAIQKTLFSTRAFWRRGIVFFRLIITSNIPFSRKLFLLLSLEELALALQFELDSPKSISDKFVFHSGGGRIKPLWTYVAELRAAEVIYISLSSERDPILNSIDDQVRWDLLVDWRIRWFFSSFQKSKFIELTPYKLPLIKDITPTWWSDTTSEIPQVVLADRSLIAVFDIEPHRNYYGYSTLNDLGYIDPSLCIKFLDEILSIANELNIAILHKPKRNIGERRILSYQKFLIEAEFKWPQTYYLIDPKIAASRVIRQSAACISMPFTSTADVANGLSISNCYFDATSRISLAEQGNLVSPLISSSVELRKWMLQFSPNRSFN